MTVALSQTGGLTFPASTALAPNLLVTRDSNNKLELAGAGTAEVFVLDERALAADQLMAAFPLKEGNVYRLTVNEATAIYADLFQAASGKISDTPAGRYIGKGLKAGAADGDIIEVIHLKKDSAFRVEAATADRTVLAAECDGRVFTTVGAAGTVVFAVPAAKLGMELRFRVGAAQELRIDPNGTEVIALPSTGVAGAAGKYLTANADGETVHLVCTKAGTWSVFGFTGTWTAEA